MKKNVAIALFSSLVFAAIAYGASLKVWSTSEKIKASDLNANFSAINTVFVGGQGARLIDADVSATAAIQWTKLASGGASSTGSFSLGTPYSTVAANATNYDGFQMAGTASTGIKFGEVTCAQLGPNVSAGTAGVLAIQNVTDTTTLCSGSFTCGTAIGTGLAVFNCNTAPLSGKLYALRFTTACGTTMPTGLKCNIEMEH